jgi:two-component system, OmpR family, sensor kinase
MRASRQIRASARLRILGWIIALTVLAVMGSLLLARRLLMERLDSEVNDALAQEIKEMSQLAAGNNPGTGRPFGNDVAAIFDTFLRRNVPEEGDAFFTFVNGAPYERSPAPVALEELPVAGGRWAGLTAPDRGELATDGGTVRWEAIPLQDDSGRTLGVFAVANFIRAERQEIADAINTALAVAAAILLLAAVVGWIAAARILRPIRNLTETARAISETDLARRIDVEGRDEVADLARTFNAMLDRLETAFATQRAFVDDAGHELRTPITIVRGHLELLDDDPDERRRTVDLVTDELDRMSRIVDDLLLLAKLQRPDFLRPEPLDVEPFTHELFAKAQALERRDWRLAGNGDGRVVADGQRLTQAVMNLARNAAEHAGEDATITLGSRRRDGEVSFWVADSGPGIAVADHAAILERFARRGGRRRSDGAGLGLAIVRAMAEAHGGRVELDSRAGAGARFTLTIPTEMSPPTDNGDRQWHGS